MSSVFYHNGKPYNFAQIAKNLNAVKRALPAILTTAAVNHFKESFRNQGFTDKRLEKWKPRNANAPRNKGRGILMDTGFLRNSIRTGKMSFAMSEVATNAPYAAAHNEGFKGTVNIRMHRRKVKQRNSNVSSGVSFVKNHTRQMNMPQRQFMGHSEVLESEFEKLIDQRIESIFNV